jgi:hypothetical protein
VSWSLTGPGSIAPTSGPTTAYTPPATGASSAQATLTATTAGLSARAAITINAPATITVTGTVVHTDGLPIPNIKVAIGSATATTDPSGHFTIPNVKTPYDVLLVHVPANGPLSGIYKGLTRPDPKLLSFGSNGFKNRSGGASGTLSGGDPLSTVNDNTQVAFASPEASAVAGITANPYTLDFEWVGPAATTGNVHALQWSPVGVGMPTGYSGYGVTNGLTVANGGVTQANVLMSAVATANIAGNVSVPVGYTLQYKTLSIDFSDGASFGVGEDNTSATSFSYLVPAGIGSTASVGAMASNTQDQSTVTVNLAGIPSGATNAVVTIPAAATLMAPANGATGVTTATDFSWTGVANAVQVVFIKAPGKPSYYVVTTGGTTKLPDLSALGEPLPAATSYLWLVEGLGPLASMDAFAEGNPLLAAGASSLQTLSASFSFTTQ